ncbi:GtrA family protein [Halorubrum lipolyticum]|uniref:GtrA family protein n=1 Tax=Halorubrum lipolyticum DSM 21995 TaxID=1227482 RepID=M0P773_9EURY|nr:GtrA family protein [Halorubrum lipolyticum]EMA64690.1 GtrA family protein [Halorubrum lipolyticum DSM 21995]
MIRAVLRNLTSGPIAVQMRRFVVVGAITAGIQMGLLWLFVDLAELNYLIGATVAIEITIVLSYVFNNAWTFEASQNTGTIEYLGGLLKTNLVRGTAIPIQLGVLYALVEWASVMYLAANAVAIFLSGLYRFVLDSQWTWG